MPTPLSKEFALLALLLAAAVWVAYAFAQEALLNDQLSAQAADLRQQNATVAAQNEGYRRDLLASSVGATADEDARAHGYARSDERIYIVGRPAPSGSPVARADVKAKVSGGVRQVAVWESFGRWIANLWRR